MRSFPKPVPAKGSRLKAKLDHIPSNFAKQSVWIYSSCSTQINIKSFFKDKLYPFLLPSFILTEYGIFLQFG